MTIQSALESLSTSLDQVSGLRPQTKTGKVNTPAAVVELDRVVAPVAAGAEDYVVRVILAVQVGDFRNCLERIWAYADPNGTVATSAMAALLSNNSVGQVTFEAGSVDYAGQTYGGGVFTCTVFD